MKKKKRIMILVAIIAFLMLLFGIYAYLQLRPVNYSKKDYTAKKIEQIAGISETKNKDIYVLKGSKNPGFEKEYDTDDPDVVVTFSDDAMSGDTFLYDKEGEFHLYITYEAPKDKIDKYLDKEAGIKNQDRTSGKIISESISRLLHVVNEKKAKELVKQGITVLTDDGQIYQIK